MKQKNTLLISLGALLAGLCLLTHPQAVKTAIGEGLRLCSTSILPSLFPFFVLTDLWIRTGGAAQLIRPTSPLMERLFHLPGAAASAFLLGCVGGYPIGARIIAQLVQEKQLSTQDAEQALLFCNNAGPAFIFGVLGVGLFQSLSAGAALYLIHLIAAVAVGLLLRPKERPSKQTQPSATAEARSFAVYLTTSITQGGASAIQVCVFILFFSVLTHCIISFLPSTSPIHPFLGLLELASGSQMLLETGLPPRLCFSAAALFLGFGGLCVYMQSLAILHPAGLTGRNLLRGKLLQAAISAVLAYFTAPLLPLAVHCGVWVLPEWSGALQQLILLLLSVLAWVFLKKSSGKQTPYRI